MNLRKIQNPSGNNSQKDVYVVETKDKQYLFVQNVKNLELFGKVDFRTNKIYIDNNFDERKQLFNADTLKAVYNAKRTLEKSLKLSSEFVESWVVE